MSMFWGVTPDPGSDSDGSDVLSHHESGGGPDDRQEVIS